MRQRNIRLVIAYDGTAYKGWQRQRNGPSIQGMLEEKLALITKDTVTVNGAGRTDAGVHAEGMVANFITCAGMPVQAFSKALNALLPKDIRILEAAEAAPDFHARYDARERRYQPIGDVDLHRKIVLGLERAEHRATGAHHVHWMGARRNALEHFAE